MALLLTYLLPLLLPTAVYMLWRLWRAHSLAANRPMSPGGHGSGTADSDRAIDWRDAPWLALALAGVALLAAVLVIGVAEHESAPSEHYVPPRMENGRIVPGELRPDTMDEKDSSVPASPSEP